jgi:hypothetical protein
VLRSLALVGFALACLMMGWLIASALWVATDADSALGTLVGIGEIDCGRQECDAWSERIADLWWLIVLVFAAGFGLAVWPWFRAHLTSWLSRWDRTERV